MLNGYFGEFQKGMRKIAPWEGLTQRFELVVGRLRSAYLVRWFGTPIPTEGLTVRVAIVNSDELRARWLAIGGDRDHRQGPPGVNLLEPLMGTSGLLAGSLALPFNAMLLAPIVWRMFDSVVAKSLAIVNWFSFGALFGTLLPIGALAVLGLPVMANTPEARSVYNLLGALAEMAQPFQEFWRQVSGPRSGVRNTLLRMVLSLADAIAAAAIQFVGLTAELVMRVAPMIGATVAGLRSAIGASMAVVEMMKAAILGTMEGLKLWWKGPTSPLAVLHFVVALFPALFRKLAGIVKSVGPVLKSKLGFNMMLAGGALAMWLASMRPFVKSQTVEHPTVMWLKSLAGSMTVFSAWNKRTAPPSPPPKPPSPPSTFGALAKSAGMYVLKRTGMPPAAPSFAMPADIMALPKAPDMAATGLATATSGNPFALTSAELGALGRWRRPPSVFGAAWNELERRRTSPEGVARVMAAADYLQRLEPILGASANLAAEQHMLDFIPALEDVLGLLDESLRPSRKHPTKLLKTPTEIRPVIGRLRVHSDAPDSDRPRFEAFVGALRGKLDAPYPVLAGAGAR